MQFLTCFLAVLATAVLSTATPITKRELGGILICNGPSATGNCTYDVYALETCVDLAAPYYANAATFSPDGEEFYCYPYLLSCGGICRSPEGCTLGAVSYNSTNKFNLTAAGGWNTLIESFECHAGTAPA